MATLSGFALAVARPPLDLGLVAFVALVPLFLAWRDVRPRMAAALGFVAGISYYGVVVSWAWYFGAVAIVPFVVALALYWAAASAAVALLGRRGLQHPALTAAVWVLGEALVARWPVQGFSWGEVGYAFHDAEFMRALGALGGLPLISFVAVTVNAGLADVAVARFAHSNRAGRDTLRASALVAVLLVLTVAWSIALPTPEPAGRLRFALLQGNDLNRELTDAELAAGYLPESHFRLAGEHLSGRYDLIVFPESVFPDAPNAPDPQDKQFMWPDRLGALAREHNAYVLANGTGDAPDGRALNLNVLWGPDGAELGSYAKRHLVPYGERVPLRSLLEQFIDAVDQIPRDFAPGQTRGLFDIRDVRIATVICFESMFGMEVRPLVRAGAEVIVVSTNNRSYRRSANSAQHLAASQIRAVETGRPVLHSSISGITAVVDADGDVVMRRELFDNGVVQGTLTARSGRTPYVRFGEWVIAAAALAVLLSAIAVFVRDRRRSVDFATA